MRHPSDGTLRRLLDQPDGVALADREHVARCDACLADLDQARADAELAGAALHVDLAPDVEAGWRRLSGVAAVPNPVAATATRDAREARGSRSGRAPRRRAGLRSPVVAAVGVLALLTGAGAAAAGDWFQVFRTEQVAPVTVTQADLVTMPDLTAYGDVEIVQEPRVRPVADAAAAEEATGLTVLEVTALPRGVTGEPVYQVGDQVSAVFTFSADQAARAAEVAGDELPPPPPGLDGSQVRLNAGPGLAATWSSQHGMPALVVARAVAPTAYSSGVPFETARDYLLSLPGLPEGLAAQLRTFSADGTTLPLPVPADAVDTSQAEVDGSPATVFATRDGALAGVVWVEDGVLTAVAGSLSTDEVLTVARGLTGQR